MSKISKIKLNSIDYAISKWSYSYGKPILRFSLAIIFIWFGYLKVILDSPAQELVANTVYWLDPEVFIPILGIWEMLIGVFFCFRPTIRLAILLLALQMPGAFLPLVILPEVCFVQFPVILSMEGQYIIKNLVLISAGIVVGGTLREKEMINKNFSSKDAKK